MRQLAVASIIVMMLAVLLAGCGEEVDVTPPAVSDVLVSSIGESSCVISWATDEPTTGLGTFKRLMEYRSSSIVDENLVDSHSVTLDGLVADADYALWVVAKDRAGNMTVSGRYDFNTAVPTSGVEIESVDLQSESVIIRNLLAYPVEMTGWRLVSTVGNEERLLPTNLVLEPDGFLQIISGRDIPGSPPATTDFLYWTGQDIWLDTGDPAELYSSVGSLVSRYP